jgi:hypothetical protein
MGIIDKESIQHQNGKLPFTRIADVYGAEARHDRMNLKPFNLLKMKRVILALATYTLRT